jgi:hypothetical protein
MNTFPSLKEARKAPVSEGGIWARFPEGRMGHGYPAYFEALQWAVAKHGELKWKGFPEWVLVERHDAAKG